MHDSTVVTVASPSGQTFAAILEHLQTDSQQYFGTPWARCDVLATHDRPYSSVVRLVAHTPEGDRTLYAKTFKPRNDTPPELERQRQYLSTEYERTRLATQAFASMPHLGVPRLIAWFPDLMAIVTEEAQGIGFDGILKRLALTRTRGARETAMTALQRVGEWLRVFQSRIPADPLQRKDHRRYLERRLQALTRLGAIAQDDSDRLLASFDDQWARISYEELNPVATHADLCPANILVARDRVTVIDLAASLDRAKYLDVAHLYMHLTLAGRRLHLGRGLTEQLRQTLLQSFEPGLRTDVPLFRLMLLQNVAVYYLFLVQSQPAGLRQRLLHGRQLRYARDWMFDFAGVPA